MKLYQPWKFPSLVSLPLGPQRGQYNNLLRVPQNRANATRSPSLPLNLRRSRNSSNFFSTRSDSEPTMCLSITPQCARRPSIVLTRASVEREQKFHGSIGSRLPSNLSLGSNDLTPAPTTPFSMFFNETSLPQNRSVTPLLFPEHKLPGYSTTSIKRSASEYLSPSPSRCNTPSIREGKCLSKSQLNLKRKLNNPLSPSSSHCSLTSKACINKVRYPQSNAYNPHLTRSPSLREKKVMTGIINLWTKQSSLEARV